MPPTADGRCDLIQDRPLPDFYRELEVSPAASAETIRAAYTALARRFHPDLNGDPGAGERMQRINEAYAVLSVPYQRRNYDLQRFKQQEPLPDAPYVEPSPPEAAQSQAAPSPLTRKATAHWPRGRPPHTPRRPQVSIGLPKRLRRLQRLRAPFRPAVAGVVGAAIAGSAATALLFSVGVLPARSGTAPSPSPVPAGRAIRVLSLTTPTFAFGTPTPVPVATPLLPPAPAAVGSPPSTTTAASLHALEIVTSIATRFATVDRLAEASRTAPTADRAWSFLANGCRVYAGEYDSPDRADVARRYWADQSARYVAESTPALVVAVGDCDVPQHQYQLLDTVRDVLTRPR